ncbi:hypothetical protein BD413DRAFT_296634 [Trametes elegans]|nr:hypothetical protein BD413DRAFT_296634 [Trametes elegans]
MPLGCRPVPSCSVGGGRWHYDGLMPRERTSGLRVAFDDSARGRHDGMGDNFVQSSNEGIPSFTAGNPTPCAVGRSTDRDGHQRSLFVHGANGSATRCRAKPPCPFPGDPSRPHVQPVSERTTHRDLAQICLGLGRLAWRRAVVIARTMRASSFRAVTLGREVETTPSGRTSVAYPSMQCPVAHRTGVFLEVSRGRRRIQG